MLRSSFAHEPEMTEVLAQYVAGLPRQARLLQTFLTEHRLLELRKVAHQIKGSAGGYGFMPVTHAADYVERMLHDHMSIEDIARGVRELLDLLRSVEGFDPHAISEAA